MAKSNLEIIISAQDKASPALGKVGSALGTIGKFAAGAAVVGIGAATTAIGGLAVGITKLTREAARLGPIEDAFRGLAEASGESADAMIDALREQSGHLITDTDLMLSYNKAAQLVSTQFANELPDAMEMVGKVAAATGQDMGFLMDSLVTGIGRLSPMILDNLGIQVDLNAAYEDYATSIGKVSDDLTKAEQQTALMIQVMDKLAVNTKNLPPVADPFTEIQVAVTNAKDAVAKAIGPVILPMIQNLASQLSNFVAGEQFQEWLKTTTDWMEKNLVPAMERFVDWASEEAPEKLADFSAWFSDDLLPVIRETSRFMNDDLMPAMNRVGEAIGKIWEVMGKGKPIFDAFIWGWKVQIDIFKAVKQAFDNVIFGLKLGIDMVKNFGNALRELGDKMPDWLVPGSPTPLELGLRGINDAMAQLNRQGLPTMTASVRGGMGMAGSAAPTGGGRNVTITYAPILSTANESELRYAITPILRDVLREYGVV